MTRGSGEAYNQHEMDKKDTSNALSLESLFRAAFLRTKERLLSYILAFLFNILITIGITLIFGLLAAILVLPFTLAKNYVMAFTWGGILLILFVGVMVYVSTWLNLLLTQILIQNEKKGVIETFKSLRPYVPGYIWLTLLNGLFFLGLLPLGFLSVFIIYLFWGFWNSFTVFVYLTEHRKGMQNLWASKDMINTNFWGIFFRLALISLATILISMLLSMTSKDNGLSSLLYILFSILSVPFVISYRYEIFKHTKRIDHPKTPKVWIILSVIGFILFLLSVVAIVSTLGADAPKYFEKYQNAPSTPYKI